MKNALVFVFTALAALSASAQTSLEVRGFLSRDGVGVDDLVDVRVVVRDAAGGEVDSAEVDGVVVVAGDFAFALDPSVEDVIAGGGVVDVSIVDPAVVAVGVIGVVAGADFAVHAVRAARADTAGALGALVAADLAQASAGRIDAPYAVANVSGAPAGLDDGDQGTIDAVGAGLTLSGTVVDVADGAVTPDKITANTIDSVAIADGAVTSAKVGTIGAADVATGTLVADDFSTVAFGSSDFVGNSQLVFQMPKGCDVDGRVSVSNTCAKRAGCGAGQQRNCGTGVCETSTVTTCATAPVGVTLFK